jgi:hypothetical protein
VIGDTASRLASCTGGQPTITLVGSPTFNLILDTATGTPQGGILSPLLANIALSVLNEHFVAAWAAMGAHSGARQQRRRRGLATYRLVRYADDFVVLVAGTRAHAEALRDEAVAVLAPMGLRLSEAKTRIAHIDEGFDFLGFRVVRQPKRGTGQRFVYTYPAKAALAAVKAKVRALTRGATDLPLGILLHGCSTRYCGDGPPTSGTACRRRPSTTFAPSSGAGWCAGSATSTAGPTGGSSAGAPFRGGGRWRAR